MPAEAVVAEKVLLYNKNNRYIILNEELAFCQLFLFFPVIQPEHPFIDEPVADFLLLKIVCLQF